MYELGLLTGVLDWDWQLFRWINDALSNGFFDSFIPCLREKWIWLPLYVFVLAFMAFQWRKRSWMVIFFFVLSFSIGDFTSASVAKPVFKRERPCNDLSKAEAVILRVPCGGGFSFPSSHATNHMAMGLFLFLLLKKVFRKYAFAFLLWPVLVSFAQIYVGVHYPFDILGGWILGAAIGFGVYKLLEFYFRYFYKTGLYDSV